MSSNGSIASNTTNTTDAVSYPSTEAVIFYTYISTNIFIIIVGTILNLWFLVAILSSQDTRSRLRNKIICNSLVLQLMESVIILPLEVWRLLSRTNISCVSFSVFWHLSIIQDFIGNWLLVMLLVVFIAQIQDYNPKLKLSSRATTVGTVGLLVFPWVASLVLVPVIVYEYYKRLLHRGDCVHPSHEVMEVFKSVDTAAPFSFAILFLIIAMILRYRRFSRGYSSGSMQTELISRGPEIDNSTAYIVATGVCIFCDLLQLIFALKFDAFLSYGNNVWFTVYGTSLIMTNTRTVLMPLPWLLLPDVRQRIRTWRPWYRPAPGIDLTVTYRKEEI